MLYARFDTQNLRQDDKQRHGKNTKQKVTSYHL